MLDYIKINKKDNVAVALKNLEKGTEIYVDDNTFNLKEDIPQGHKFSIEEIESNEKIIKYGMTIGIATENTNIGSWMHTHNIKTSLGDILNYKYEPKLVEPLHLEHSTFKGFRRKNGKVGIRNDIWIIPTVGCINSICNKLAIDFNAQIKSDEINTIAFTHPYGCSQMGDDQENTRKALAALISHPNAGGVLVLGLGCENSNIEILRDYIGEYDTERIKFIQCQDEDDEYSAAQRELEEIFKVVSRDTREEIDSSELVVGLKCGGSDGLSGITANPLVGEFSDILIAKGGSTILTEVPEMFGAETSLMDRAESEEIFSKVVKLVNDFKIYFQNHNQTIYENPSPGNKQGGISTLEDKSNGCIQKSGDSNIVDVLDYAEQIKKAGLNLLNAPGNDLVSSTALALSGAHIVLFTTGRGTPFSCPVPTIKISSNTELFEKKRNWIDFDAGKIVRDVDKHSLALELFDYVSEVASGKKISSEGNFSQEWAIFKQGVTL
ncbi:altronate hydrolase [Anaerosphaera aminiphila DSM 21120]|uniref:Altronate hydrolase n=1 Tax=Anaerosphaera aminiphila DSM 21120 TaxID=1120995 RepID=A0A1M5U5I6_9FIRM|nr:altronate dehydratase family protein [Anaerosphaera aminiphila]SHH58277.1 altronate hydrolase [Anaerosphaera aminiphila DSM 21120]